MLAAGLGTRLRPLTLLYPKPLCPVNNRPLLELSLDLLAPHCGTGASRLAVNAHHLSEQVRDWAGERVMVSVEPELLGTAGAIARLRDWRSGRNLLLLNGDAYLPGGAEVLAPLLHEWSGDTVRMLVVDAERYDRTPDFSDQWAYIGGCLLPADLLEPLQERPSGLFNTVWQPAREAGRLEFIEHTGVAIDTGTPSGYLTANLHANAGDSVIAPTAQVLGTIDRCVLLPAAVVTAGEQLRTAIRAPALESSLSDEQLTIQVDLTVH